MKILIPDNQNRNVLAAIRSLARQGHEITLAVPTGAPLKGFASARISKYVRRKLSIHSAALTPAEFAADIENLVAREHFDVILPFSHAAVLPVSYYKDRLTRYAATPIADYSVLVNAHDKLKTMQLAHRLGVPIPVTFCPADRDELVRRKDQIPFPCLVKARQGCGIGATIRFARNWEELLEGYDVITGQTSFPPVTDFTRPIIQEYVPGQIHDGLYLYQNGVCRAAATQERVITYPVSGGTAAMNTTTDDPRLNELGRRLLDGLGWHGPSQVEFRLDSRDGQYKLLEINPKFWGSLVLTMVAGIDFATLAAEMAATGFVTPHFDYRVGVTYHWLFPDETYCFVEDPSWKRLRKMLEFGAPDTYFDWDARDPVPDLARMFGGLWTALFNRGRILPARYELIEQALQRPPAQQPEGVF